MSKINEQQRNIIVGNYRHWRVRFRENGNNLWRETTYSGYKNRQQIIEWFGLNSPDVDDYELTEETYKP